MYIFGEIEICNRLYMHIHMVGVHLPLSRLPVYFCFTSPSISAYLPRLYSLTSPSIKSQFPVYSFFASLPRLYCFISPIIILQLPGNKEYCS